MMNLSKMLRFIDGTETNRECFACVETNKIWETKGVHQKVLAPEPLGILPTHLLNKSRPENTEYSKKPHVSFQL